ncbi:hypothetical protein FRC12_024148 [Ceratobasidium sp. 428]|nr:hypothetical protein FRC12_024148 [Ceratobasidium sp. 428]
MPELLTLVCSFLEIKDCAACLLLFRHTFTSVAAIVWEDVDFKSVLLLIPGVQATTTIEKRYPRLTFRLPATVDLARFKVYYSFVKAVSTSAPYAITFPEEWPGDNAQVTLRPLLPNLRSITINTFGRVPDRYVNWVPRLLTPGLREFKMCSIPLENSAGEDVADHENAWIDPSKCIELIDAISQTCPTIEILGIFAHEEEDEEDQTEYNILCEKVGGLHNLRFLSFGGASAGETLFRVFARLPHLKYLSLVSDHTQTMPYTESLVMLSDDSFPALQHLTFCGVNPTIVTRVYNSPWLFCRLASAEIIYEDLSYDEHESDYLRSAYAMKCFSHGCSHLTDLTIITEGRVGRFRLYRQFIPIFKQLPLRCLRLCRVDLNPDLEQQDEDEFEDMLEQAGLERNNPPMTWEEFLAALPHLEVLYMNNSFRVWDLVAFADSLPKLRYFALDTIRASSESDTFGGATGPTATQPIVICCNYPRFKYAAPDPKEILERARQIHEIWPNAEFGAHEDTDWAQYMESQLNKAIRALRLKG